MCVQCYCDLYLGETIHVCVQCYCDLYLGETIHVCVQCYRHDGYDCVLI